MSHPAASCLPPVRTSTPESSYKSPRPAPPTPPSSQTRSDTPPLRRMSSEPFISRIETRVHNSPLKYDHFASQYVRGPIRKGYVEVQRDKFRSWTWTRRMWLVLDDKWLYACQKMGSEASDALALFQVRHLERINTKRFCLMVATSFQKWYLVFKDPVSLHDWLYDIRIRCPLLRIGAPIDFRHEMHVTYDPIAGEITGLPEPWIETLSSWGLGPDFNGSHKPESPLIGSPMSAPTTSPAVSTRADVLEAPSPPSMQQRRRHRSASEAGTASVVPSVDQFRRSPNRYQEVDARDLTGAVRTAHLLPASRGEHCDIWKGEWSGSFGTRKVAIQVVRVPGTIGDWDKDRLSSIVQREARALHQLRHLNVLRTRGLCRDHGQGPLPALVSTWLSRGNIMDYLNNRRPAIEKARKLKLLTEVAAGLNYLHNFSRTIIHGDLRGANILISDAGNACISGFGLNPIMQALPALNKPVSTCSSPTSPRWAAVEVIRDGRRAISHRADVFSFARTVLEVMTGKDPYDYLPDDVEVLSAVLRGVPPRRPPVFGDDGLWQLIERCWRDEPIQRPSMALVLLRMEEMLHNPSAGRDPPNPAPP